MLISIETLLFSSGVRTSGSAHAYDRSTCFFSEANPVGQVFSCNGLFSIARATSNTYKHDEVFYLDLHLTYRDFKWSKHALKRKLWEAEKTCRSCTYIFDLLRLLHEEST